jgi:hypothetical protein
MAERDGCRIDDVCARRGLPTLPDRLVRRRTEANASLRDLERLFNHEALATAIRAAGMELFTDEAANVYRLLTDDDTRHRRRALRDRPRPCGR